MFLRWLTCAALFFVVPVPSVFGQKPERPIGRAGPLPDLIVKELRLEAAKDSEHRAVVHVLVTNIGDGAARPFYVMLCLIKGDFTECGWNRVSGLKAGEGKWLSFDKSEAGSPWNPITLESPDYLARANPKREAALTDKGSQERFDQEGKPIPDLDRFQIPESDKTNNTLTLRWKDIKPWPPPVLPLANPSYQAHPPSAF